MPAWRRLQLRYGGEQREHVVLQLPDREEEGGAGAKQEITVRAGRRAGQEAAPRALTSDPGLSEDVGVTVSLLQFDWLWAAELKWRQYKQTVLPEAAAADATSAAA
ncbi:hypothetical protein SRHO_G00139950 [Serrasalmus rhombeus]